MTLYVKLRRRSLMLGACALAVGVAFGGSAFAADAKKTLAFVVNVPADFWTIARRGTEKAQAELPNYNIEF
jgi:ribose transport system substrate-binding protein